jgi:glucan 1,3-beta-glucosidase
MNVGNQQYTMRALTFNNVVTAVNLLWDWGWTFQGLSINNCKTGLNIAAGGSSAQNVGSVTLIDSTFTNTPLGIVTAYTSSSSPPTAGSLILENIQLNNVPVAVQSPSGNVLLGTTGSMNIAGWGEGHKYVPNGPTAFQGAFNPNSRPSSLLSGSSYYTRSKPQYNALPISSFVSTRSASARGDGVTDDTAALQAVINSAASAGRVVFFDAGTYKVTSTLQIPPGSKLVGETYSVIMSSGSFFNNINSPQPVVRVGTAGQTGQVEWSDMIVATQGTQAGAVLIEVSISVFLVPEKKDKYSHLGIVEPSHIWKPFWNVGCTHPYRWLRRLQSPGRPVPHDPQLFSNQHSLHRRFHVDAHHA